MSLTPAVPKYQSQPDFSYLTGKCAFIQFWQKYSDQHISMLIWLYHLYLSSWHKHVLWPGLEVCENLGEYLKAVGNLWLSSEVIGKSSELLVMQRRKFYAFDLKMSSKSSLQKGPSFKLVLKYINSISDNPDWDYPTGQPIEGRDQVSTHLLVGLFGCARSWKINVRAPSNDPAIEHVPTLTPRFALFFQSGLNRAAQGSVQNMHTETPLKGSLDWSSMYCTVTNTLFGLFHSFITITLHQLKVIDTFHYDKNSK